MADQHTLPCAEDSYKTIDLYKVDGGHTRFAIAINDGSGRRQYAYLSEETLAEMITWFLDVESEE